MSEENQALQRQLLLKHEKEVEKLRASVSTFSELAISLFRFFHWVRKHGDNECLSSLENVKMFKHSACILLLVPRLFLF